MSNDNIIPINPTEAQLDEDLELVTDYVMRTMTDAQAEAFEQRLGDDEAFFNRVAPMLKVWYSRAPGYTMAWTRERIRVKSLRTNKLESMEVPPPAAHAPDLKVLPSAGTGNDRASRRRYFPYATRHIIAASAALSSAAAALTLALRLTQSPAVTQLIPMVASAPVKDTSPPTITASAPTPTTPKRPAPPQVVAVVEPPTIPVTSVDRAITIDSLPPAQSMEIHVEPLFDPHSPAVVQWPPTVSAAPESDLHGIARRVGSSIAGLWGRIIHHGTPTPTKPPPTP